MSGILGRAYNIRVHKANGNTDLHGYSLGLYWYLNELGSLVIKCVDQGRHADQVLHAYPSGKVAHIEILN